MTDVTKLVSDYITIRDKKAERVSEHKAELERFDRALKKIEGLLSNALGEAESIKTSAGTCYRSTRSSATVKDRDALIEFIKTNDAWGLLPARVNDTVAAEYLESTGTPPPGIMITRRSTINIRRS